MPTTTSRPTHGSGGQRAASPHDRCRCGQAAVIVFLVDRGEEAYCGQPRGRRATHVENALFRLWLGVLVAVATVASLVVTLKGF